MNTHTLAFSNIKKHSYFYTPLKKTQYFFFKKKATKLIYNSIENFIIRIPPVSFWCQYSVEYIQKYISKIYIYIYIMNIYIIIFFFEKDLTFIVLLSDIQF